MAGSGTSWAGTTLVRSAPPLSGPTGGAWRPSGTRGRSGSGTPAAGGSSGPSAWAPGPVDGARQGLSWSPDGRRLAERRAGDGLVRIWDPETGRETARIAQNARVGGLEPGRDPDRLGPGRASRAGGPPLGRPGRAAAAGPSSQRPGWVRRALLVARRSPAGRQPRLRPTSGSPAWGLTVWDATSGDRVFRVEHVTRAVDRSPSAPTAPGWRRAARKGSCGCSTRRMAGSTPPCSPGAPAGQRPGVQPRWPPALRRRLGDGRGQGLRPGPRSARPAASPSWTIRSGP